MTTADWIVVFVVWIGLPLFLFGMKIYFDHQWVKKFGERKP